MLIAAAQAPVAAPIEEEVVVIGQRVRRISYRVGKDRRTGKVACELLRGSGDALLDTRVCEMARRCTPANVTNKDRKRVMACVKAGEQKIIAQRAAERRVNRAKTGG